MMILVVGGLGFLGVHTFGQYVDSLSDLPTGPTPLSWKFKLNTSLDSQTFSNGEYQVNKTPLNPEIPPIDQADYPVTQTAMFALG